MAWRWHDDFIKWKHSSRYWPFVRRIHRSRWIPLTKPVTPSFDVFFELRLNKRSSKQSCGWWFETLSHPLWCHHNGPGDKRFSEPTMTHICVTRRLCAWACDVSAVDTLVVKGSSSSTPRFLHSLKSVTQSISCSDMSNHDDVNLWKYSPRYWPFVREIHRSPVDSPHKGQWRGALIFSLICTWTNSWANNRDSNDLRRHRAHYGVSVMKHNKASYFWIVTGYIMHYFQHVADQIRTFISLLHTENSNKNLYRNI